MEFRILEASFGFTSDLHPFPNYSAGNILYLYGKRSAQQRCNSNLPVYWFVLMEQIYHPLSHLNLNLSHLDYTLITCIIVQFIVCL